MPTVDQRTVRYDPGQLLATMANWRTSNNDRWWIFAGVAAASSLRGLLLFAQGEWRSAVVTLGLLLLVSYGFVFVILPRVEHWINHGLDSGEKEVDYEHRSG